MIAFWLPRVALVALLVTAIFVPHVWIVAVPLAVLAFVDALTEISRSV